MEPIKEHSSKKALYLLLCGLLGMILFVIIQQAAILLLMLLLLNQGGSLESSQQVQLNLFDGATYILAIFFGAWYGIWLGMHWYNIVYEQGRRGLFHAFLGRLAGNGHQPIVEDKTPIMARPQEQPKPEPKPKVIRPKTWGFEDLAKLRPVLPRPQRMPAISSTATTEHSASTDWSKKVSVKPAPVKKVFKKPASNGNGNGKTVKRAPVARKATAKITQPL